MAFRTFVAPPPPSDACRRAAVRAHGDQAARTDVTMFFELGVHWGR